MSTAVGDDVVGNDRSTFAQSELAPVSLHSKTRLTWPDRILFDLHDSEINALSGAAAGVLSAVMVCPLDVAKTKLQAQGGFLALQRDLAKKNSPYFGSEYTMSTRKYNGLVGTLSTIVREEGVRGLYRGVVPITIGYLPTWAIYFMVYEEIKNMSTPHLSQFPFAFHMVSALAAGATSTLVTNPIWVIKTRLMTQSPTNMKYTGTLDAFRKMYRNEGILSFYTGLGPALLGLLHVAVQFPLYEKIKHLLHINENESKFSQTPKILLASVLSKICASTITYPHEVIRTRVQIQPIKPPRSAGGTTPTSPPKRKYRGIIQTAKTIYIEEGWRAFYSGLGTNMVRTVPASAVMLLSYEIAASYLRQERDTLRTSISAWPDSLF